MSADGRWPWTMHGFWPRADTELLLRAALSKDAAAERAFEAWLARNAACDPAKLDSPDRRLLPLVAANLDRPGRPAPWLARCAPVFGTMEAMSRQQLVAAGEAVHVLEAAGIPALVLKGAVLVLKYYGNPALRPMTDVDVLVRPEDTLRAREALVAAGWTGRPVSEGLRPYLHAFELRRAGDASSTLDLHQHLIDHGSTPAADRGLWRRAVPFDGLGVPAWAPCATDLLLHVCLAGVKRGRFGNSRWVADAATILERDAAVIDWGLLVREARARRVVLRLRECLAYLAGSLDLPVPREVLDALFRERIRGSERRAYRALTRFSRTLADSVQEHRCLYESGSRAAGLPRSPFAFAAFLARHLRRRWRIESPWRMLPKLLERTMALVGARPPWRISG